MISPDGSVSSATVAEGRTSLGVPPLHACMLEIVRALRFPAPGDTHVGVNYPWLSSPSDVRLHLERVAVRPAGLIPNAQVRDEVYLLLQRLLDCFDDQPAAVEYVSSGISLRLHLVTDGQTVGAATIMDPPTQLAPLLGCLESGLRGRQLELPLRTPLEIDVSARISGW